MNVSKYKIILNPDNKEILKGDTIQLQNSSKNIIGGPYTINKSDFKLRRIIEHKKYAAIMAASRAIEYFPHNDDFFEDGELIPCFASGKWTNLQIYLTYDDEKNTILVEFNRYNGDHISFHFVANIIDAALKAPTLLNWIQRSDYLAFVEGIEYDRKTPALKYLCDDMVKREISSYL